MDTRSALLTACVMACTVLAAPGVALATSALSVTVVGVDGRPVAGVVVLAEPVAAAPRPATGLKAIMDQRDLMFVPDVLVVQTGTAVDFPNSDQVRHQVYSFSSARPFQLALYAGRAHAPVVFDHAGLVTLGCNIHDSMVGYIWVTDSPWFGRTGANGTLQLHDLAPGEYHVRIWHARLAESGPQLQTRLNLADGATASADFRLRQPLKAPLMNHGADKKWADY
jgi:plastocyanin